MKLMSKLNRISAWILWLLFLFYIFSGLDILKRIFNPILSIDIHLVYIFIPTMVCFAFHSAYSIFTVFKRKKSWNVLTKVIIGVYLLILTSVSVLYYVL